MRRVVKSWERENKFFSDEISLDTIDRRHEQPAPDFTGKIINNMNNKCTMHAEKGKVMEEGKDGVN